MFLARLISEVRKELNNMSFAFNCEIEVIKTEKNKSVFRFEDDNQSYIVEYYYEGNIKDIVDKQLQLEKYGIKTGILFYSEKIIIYKDYERSGIYRTANNDDLNDENFIVSLAKWYKKIHSIRGLVLSSYSEFFTLNNISKLVENFNLHDSFFFKYVISNFNNIKLKLERINKCPICGELSLQNIIVSKNNMDFFVIKLDNLCEGFSGVDISYCLSIIDEKFRELFLNVYGEIGEDELILNEILSVILALKNFDGNLKSQEYLNKYLRLINSGKLLERVKSLVEWY